MSPSVPPNGTLLRRFGMVVVLSIAAGGIGCRTLSEAEREEKQRIKDRKDLEAWAEYISRTQP